MKTLLITGISGFLGSHLALRLQSKYCILGLKRLGSNLWRFDGENNNIQFINDLELLKKYKIDYIIHTATNYGRNGESISQILEANIIFALQILEFAQKQGIKTFINCDTLQNPLASPYCLSKSHLSEYFKYFKTIKIINAKIEHMYGPKDDENKFICYLINNLMKDKNIELTKGEQMRDFVYIDDVISAFESIIYYVDSLDSMDTFEIGSGKQIKLRDFCEKILIMYNEIMKKPSNANLLFGLKEYNEFENMNIKADIRALKNMGWIPKTSIDDGIKQTILYYINNVNRGGVAQKYKIAFANISFFYLWIFTQDYQNSPTFSQDSYLRIYPQIATKILFRISPQISTKFDKQNLAYLQKVA
ncbi:NAD(P)-dependent oxidoreductase [Helicobacter sp. 16-1353]|uniref:NAD-dependent epimerase/dehydratase family protein n=1 Tax=Helicobacter sp. 16-1353 TaxID=2004996 RepID=UPI0015EF7653|nr:NAD(P)-dependent oxidoreductase [Helicobacter sp. 16-1353]